MAGEAKTSAFLLSTATVMIGPPANLFDLNPATHSIGLVKNFSLTSEPAYTELTQGVRNQIVYSVMTSNPVRASMEVYEYTSKNLVYGLGLDGSAFVGFPNSYLLKTAITGNSTPVVTATFDAVTNVAADFPIGAWISIQDPGVSDRVHYAKLSATTNTTGTAPDIEHTLTFAGYGFGAGNNMAQNAIIKRVNAVNIGEVKEQPFLGAKITYILPENNEPATILMPKLRITRGFSMAISSEQYGNLPFEFTPYELVSTDPLYAEFGGKGVARLMIGQ